MKTDLSAIFLYLKKNLDPARFKHTLGTLKIAVPLSEKYGADPAKARVAALLHDAGKGFSSKELVRYVKRNKMRVPDGDEIVKHNPSLFHSYVSAHVARKLFKIRDTEILNAIALHTLGAQKMSLLAKIIYVADSITPDRRFPEVKKIRFLAARDIDKAVRAAMANKIYYVIKKKKWLHPEAFKALNGFADK
ncbi:MAG: bis(5'-nucleosyl)-tetraphosphatase (symmetrical) YqeK [Endomicrobiales bacterium]|nr:bis(5'-nucleosyl)-tetraphosphatase (symmetrical) YqeK [Endomicrobiales bacterium]